MDDAGDDSATVTARVGSRGLATQIAAGGHSLLSDEPVLKGGTASGPSPYDYLLASLGSCTAMTLRLYADRKGWPLEGVEVRLRHRRIYAEDCEDCEKKTGRIDVIERQIALEGPLDAEQRKRLLEIADHCPVHRTLTGEIKIRTELVAA
jgi:putative redox protein